MKKKLTNLMMGLLVMVCAGFWPNETLAQFRPAVDVQEWPKGKVVLVTGDTLYGAITYHRTQDIVNVQHSDGSVSSLSPVNVDYFVAQEMPSGRSHMFRTLQWDMGKEYTDFKKPTFFEELNRGTLTLVMRETYVRRDANNSRGLASNYLHDAAYYSANNQWMDQVKELYYILLPDGNIISLRNVRKDLHTLFGDRSKEVKKYVRKYNLDYSKPHELVAIVNYFNTLSLASISHAF
ncbi:hypothetical protein ACFSRY_13325 [Pontibacter locisalis]|uniref:DUF4369 domain-containing protein n=1 Tax=Pontibacter locisalis TaxID=1719035 RepID=A0ABW5INZ7_9BACT